VANGRAGEVGRNIVHNGGDGWAEIGGGRHHDLTHGWGGVLGVDETGVDEDTGGRLGRWGGIDAPDEQVADAEGVGDRVGRVAGRPVVGRARGGKDGEARDAC
jgi:hypothetical protein